MGCFFRVCQGSGLNRQSQGRHKNMKLRMKKDFVWLFGSLFFVVLSLNLVTCLFNISTETWNTDGNILHLKRLKNLKTEESALIHLYGGKLEALQLLNTEKKLVDLLLGHNSNATAVIANSYWRGAILIPFANRIANGTYIWNGKTLYLKKNDVFGLKNALHGLLYHVRKYLLNI